MIWTPEKDDFLRGNYLEISNRQLAAELGVKPGSVSWRLHTIGLRRRRQPRPWTAAEDDFLRANINKLNCTELAAQIDRSKLAVAGRMVKLGLKRTPDASRRMQLQTAFKKGLKPWNKGKKGLRLSPETEFRAGHKPHNTLHDGAIRTRHHKRTNTPYKWIRIAEAHWIMLHVFVWEKANGPVPAGHIVVFKNKNTLDVRLSNLECISLAENARRNANPTKAAKSLKKYRHNPSDRHIAGWIAPGDPELRQHIIRNHPELLQAKRLQLKLKRSINAAERKTR